MKAEMYNWQDFGTDDMIEIRVDADMLNVIRAYLYRSVDDMIEDRETENALDLLEMIRIIEQKLDFETKVNDDESDS